MRHRVFFDVDEHEHRAQLARQGVERAGDHRGETSRVERFVGERREVGPFLAGVVVDLTPTSDDAAGVRRHVERDAEQERAPAALAHRIELSRGNDEDLLRGVVDGVIRDPGAAEGTHDELAIAGDELCKGDRGVVHGGADAFPSRPWLIKKTSGRGRIAIWRSMCVEVGISRYAGREARASSSTHPRTHPRFSMFARSLFVPALASMLFAFSLVACSDAPDTASDEAVGDDALAATGESELKTHGFLGRWTAEGAAAGNFRSLALEAGGRYRATIAVCPPATAGGVSCLALPRDESGRFTIVRAGSKETLRLAPVGASVRRYQIAFAPTVAVVGAPRAIELTRAGKSQVLDEDVGAAGEACGATRCGPGLVCCNPLSAICTKPGEFCAQ